jgi:hypothetical protein
MLLFIRWLEEKNLYTGRLCQFPNLGWCCMKRPRDLVATLWNRVVNN